MLWDVSEGKKLYNLEANETIHALCFSPNRYWLCAATDSNIKVGILVAHITASLLEDKVG